MKKLLSIAVSTAMVVGILGSSAIAAPKTTAKKLVDGSYKAAYDYIDSHGWKPTIDITVKGGNIVKVNFDYVSPEGKLKTKDKAYNASMFKVNKTNPAKYCFQLDNALVKSQDPNKVDTISGATHSSANFKALAAAAVENAKKGNKKAAVLFMNDTYTASADNFDAHGWKAQVSLTYENGKLTKVDYDYLDKTGKKKSQDANYNTTMKAKSGVSAKEAQDKLAQTYLTSGKVDTVTGATETSKNFGELVEKAKAMRK